MRLETNNRGESLCLCFLVWSDRVTIDLYNLIQFSTMVGAGGIEPPTKWL